MAVGTNDFIHGTPERERFLHAYRDLLERARRDAPAAHLFLVVSPMLTEEYPVPRAHSTAMEWLAAFRDELVASGAHATVVEQQFAKDEPQGCAGHPSVKTHARLGAELAAVMHAELGW
jgi:lysophospholipase L1-like esterase